MTNTRTEGKNLLFVEQSTYRLRKVNIKHRVVFDPNNKDHIKEYRDFLKKGNWGKGCSFYLEDPYLDIPTMINAKIVAQFVKK